MRHTPHGRFIVLDFETTGLSPREGARVIEVSAREVVDGEAGEEFLTFIDPGVRVPARITQITGITPGMVRGAPTSAIAMQRLAAFLGTSPVVGHNIAFDRQFLEHEAGEHLAGRQVRTLLLARRMLPGRPCYRLGSLIDAAGIARPERLHRASADTWVTLHLFGRLCEHAHSACGSRPLDHDLLDRLQRVRIAAAHDWLRDQDRGTPEHENRLSASSR